MKKIKVRLSDGSIIERVANQEQVGNFVMIWVRYKGKKYLVNDGDEYLRGYPPIYKLGKEIG